MSNEPEDVVAAEEAAPNPQEFAQPPDFEADEPGEIGWPAGADEPSDPAHDALVEAAAKLEAGELEVEPPGGIVVETVAPAAEGAEPEPAAEPAAVEEFNEPQLDQPVE